MTFHTKKSTTRFIFVTEISTASPYPKITMSSHILIITEGMEMNNQTKMKIRVGSVVKAKVGDLENIKMEGRIRRMRKEVLGCVHSVVGKNNFLFQF